nr:retrovirus-related Pol polyprotein from transposon TNT 1-94 [Tanacetum cinerariifolium]
YELLSGKVPNIRHLKPFGYRVTILNTSDHLRKFERKTNDGFLIGYAAHSKAYRVYNLSSKKTNPPASTHETNILAGTQADDSESENLVPAAGDPAGSVVRTGGVPAGSVPASGVPAGNVPASRALAGSIVSTGGVPAGGVPASDVPAGSVLASSVSASGVLAGSIVSAEFGDPAARASDPAVFTNDPAAISPLPPGHSLGSCEHIIRFPSPSDLGNHQPTVDIFSSSSYDDDFCADVTNLILNVAVDPVATKRVNTIHP